MLKNSTRLAAPASLVFDKLQRQQNTTQRIISLRLLQQINIIISTCYLLFSFEGTVGYCYLEIPARTDP